MDNEADIILEDTISFCQRDECDARIISMLQQSQSSSLSDKEMTIRVPSRFAYSYLMKQREILERYLEEITFSPLSLRITVPQVGTEGADEEVDLAREEGEREVEETTSPVASEDEDPEALIDPGISVSSVTSAAGDGRATAGGKKGASPDHAADAGERGADPARRATGGRKRPRAGGAAADDPADPDASAPQGMTVTNTLSQDAFRAMVDTLSPAKGRGGDAAGETVAPGADERRASRSVPAYAKFTFKNFVYGEENKQAYHSSVRFAALADEPGSCTSLFIYGNSGLGKTHLLLAIKNYLSEQKPYMRVKYANSQAYIDDFIQEVAAQKQANRMILRDYHAADILVIDDIQNILGKSASIDYFFRLIDEFIRNNKKIVVASDRAPKKLEMDERLTSRFNGGMLCLVSEPGFEMKYAIMKQYYEHNVLAASRRRDLGGDGADPLLSSIYTGGGHLSDEQLRHMAEISGTNIRELESFCERCACDSYEKEKAGGELEGEEIEAIANEYFDTARKRIRIDTIQSIVEEFYHVSHEELIGPRRTANIAFARHVAVYLSIDMCETTTPMVGAEFGGRDHSTVLNSIKVVEKKMKTNRSLCDELQQLRNKIILKS